VIYKFSCKGLWIRLRSVSRPRKHPYKIKIIHYKCLIQGKFKGKKEVRTSFLNLKIKELNRQLYAEKTTPVPWEENVKIMKELENAYKNKEER